MARRDRALEIWTSMFQNKVNNLGEGDTWHLEFDYSIVIENPEPGWKEYIRNTCAWFRCIKCRRQWPSNWVKIIFHMRLMEHTGTVKVRPYRQKCKICKDALMGDPDINEDSIDIILNILMEKIRIKCYGEKLGQDNPYFQRVNVKSPHEPEHCEACLEGHCTRQRTELSELSV